MFIRTPRSVVLLTGETFLLLTAVVAGTFMQLGPLALPALSGSAGILRVVLTVAICQVCLHYADLYDLPRIQNVREFLVRLVLAVGATALIVIVLYSWFPRWVIGPGVLLAAGMLVIWFVPSWRLTFAWLTRVAPRERLLIVGTNPAAVELARELNDRRHELGVEIVGFADADIGGIGRTVLGHVVGAVEDIAAMIRDSGAERIVVSLSDARGKLPMNQLLDLRLQADVSFDYLASAYEAYTGKIAVETLRPSWFVFSAGFRRTRLLLWAKRALDVAFALIGLVVTAPVVLAAAALIRLTSTGAALYRQERVGLNGRVFTIYKLRTMRVDAEAETGPVWSTLRDARVTPLGRFLRKSRVDELPQLWNVLRGDMSVIGPRPERPEFVTQLAATIAFFSLRHHVKPGITGWAQVHIPYAASVEEAVEKLQYDLYYIKNLSLWLDLVILAETVKTVLRQRGAR